MLSVSMKETSAGLMTEGGGQKRLQRKRHKLLMTDGSEGGIEWQKEHFRQREQCELR